MPPLRSLTSAVLFAVAASFLLQSWELGWLLTVSLAIHELGHVALIQRHGIPWEIRFGLFGAATITPREERQTLDRFQDALIHIAGPLANTVQAFVALAIYALSGLIVGGPYTVWLRVTNFAALLTVLNLLPLGRLSDGGKFAQDLFASLTERQEGHLLRTLMFWLISLAWFIAVSWGDTLRTLGSLSIGAWFVIGMIIHSRRDDPAAAYAADAMSERQAGLLFGAVAGALLICTALVVVTPFWLTPAQAATIARNANALYALVTARGGPVAQILLIGAALLFLAVLIVAPLVQRKRDHPPPPPSGEN